MSELPFKQQSLILARQLYPELDGEALIAEASRIYTYISDNDFNNFVALSSLSKSVVEFASLLHWNEPTNINDNPLLLYDFQKTALERMQAGDSLVLVSARQMGTTTMLAIYALWLATFKTNKCICILSNKMASAHAIRDMILHFHRTSNMKLPEMTVMNASYIAFDNQTEIFFGSRPAAFRGRTINYLLADNTGSMSWADEPVLTSLYNVMGHGAQAVFAGVAGPRAGFFYKIGNHIKGTAHAAHKYMELPWHLHPERDTNWALLQRQIMGNDAFETEYNLDFSTLPAPGRI